MFQGILFSVCWYDHPDSFAFSSTGTLLCMKVPVLPILLVLFLLVVCVHGMMYSNLPPSPHHSKKPVFPRSKPFPTLSLSPSPFPSFLLLLHSYLLSDPICFHLGVPSSISFRLGLFNSVAHAFIDSNSSSSGSPVPLHRT